MTSYIYNWDRLSTYKSARGLCSHHSWSRWPLLKAVTFSACSFIPKALMIIKRNTLRTPAGTQIYPEILDEIIFQLKSTRKAPTILVIM